MVSRRGGQPRVCTRDGLLAPVAALVRWTAGPIQPNLVGDRSMVSKPTQDPSHAMRNASKPHMPQAGSAASAYLVSWWWGTNS